MKNGKGCCGAAEPESGTNGYIVARMKKTANVCPMCEDYAARNREKKIAVMCCEGACLRGEVARQAANILCHELLPDKTARRCLGGAFTKETGQRTLVKNAWCVLAVEGCFINCASRMMGGVIDGLKTEVVVADRLYEFDRSLFGIDELPKAEIEAHARTVAEAILAKIQSCSRM